MQAEGPEGIVIRRASAADAAAVRELVFGVLAEYGFTPEPGGTDADLLDLEAGYFAPGGHFEVALDPGGAIVGCCGLRPLDGGRIELETATALKEAIALYRRAGFLPRPGKPDTCRCDLAFVLELS